MSEEYENGDWSGGVGTVVPGRPRLYDEELETVTFRISKSRVRAIDARARRDGSARSQFLRQAVDAALLSDA